MSRTRARLSVVGAEPAAAAPLDVIQTETYRLLDIEDAARTLHLAAVRLHATPRYPEIAAHRAMMKERFEEAVEIMRGALK